MRTNSWKKGKLKHKILNFNFPHRKNEYSSYSSEGMKFQLKFQKEWKSMPKIPKEWKFMPKFRKEWKFMPKILSNSRLVHPFPESRTPWYWWKPRRIYQFQMLIIFSLGGDIQFVMALQRNMTNEHLKHTISHVWMLSRPICQSVAGIIFGMSLIKPLRRMSPLNFFTSPGRVITRFVDNRVPMKRFSSH